MKIQVICDEEGRKVVENMLYIVTIHTPREGFIPTLGLTTMILNNLVVETPDPADKASNPLTVVPPDQPPIDTP